MDAETWGWLAPLAVGILAAAGGAALLLGALARDLRARQELAELADELARRRQPPGAGPRPAAPGATAPLDPTTRRLHAIVDMMLAEDLKRGT